MISFAQSLAAARKIRIATLMTVAVVISAVSYAAVAADGDAEAGKAKSAICTACHGPNGNSVVATWPSIAGQHANYLEASLLAFRSGERGDPVMGTQALNLSDQDIADLAAYYAAQSGARRTANTERAARGERLYRGGNKDTDTSACIACHGPTGRGNAPAGYPSLTGQHAVYTEKQLNDYKNNLRKTDGDTGPMRMIAERLTNEEVQDVAAYIQGLR
jgi:cytochrome c553